MVELQPSKLVVAGSNPVARSLAPRVAPVRRRPVADPPGAGVGVIIVALRDRGDYEGRAPVAQLDRATDF